MRSLDSLGVAPSVLVDSGAERQAGSCAEKFKIRRRSGGGLCRMWVSPSLVEGAAGEHTCIAT